MTEYFSVKVNWAWVLQSTHDFLGFDKGVSIAVRVCVSKVVYILTIESVAPFEYKCSLFHLVINLTMNPSPFLILQRSINRSQPIFHKFPLITHVSYAELDYFVTFHSLQTEIEPSFILWLAVWSRIPWNKQIKCWVIYHFYISKVAWVKFTAINQGTEFWLDPLTILILFEAKGVLLRMVCSELGVFFLMTWCLVLRTIIWVSLHLDLF
jgi:hypothetical protein